MRYKISHGLDCCYDRVPDYIEDTHTGKAVVIFDPSEGEYMDGCPDEFHQLVLDALNFYENNKPG